MAAQSVERGHHCVNYWERWIGDWKRKTAHLSAEERGIYAELLDHAYATESPLPANRIALQRIAGINSQTEIESLSKILEEFFSLTEQGYRNKRVDEEIAKRREFIESRRIGANARWAATREQKAHKGNGSKPIIDDSSIIEMIQLNTGEEWPVHESFSNEMQRLYPVVDVPLTLKEIRAWCLSNPTKLKTKSGVKRFINGWFARIQDRGN